MIFVKFEFIAQIEGEFNVVELEDGMIRNLEAYTWSITKLVLEEGLVLKQPLSVKDLICDLAINNFFNEFKIQLLQEAISQDRDLNLVYKKSNQEILKPNLSV